VLQSENCLITPATPAADSRWPILVFTEPALGESSFLAIYIPYRLHFDRVTQGSACTMSFDIANPIGFNPSVI